MHFIDKSIGTSLTGSKVGRMISSDLSTVKICFERPPKFTTKTAVKYRWLPTAGRKRFNYTENFSTKIDRVRQSAAQTSGRSKHVFLYF